MAKESTSEGSAGKRRPKSRKGTSLFDIRRKDYYKLSKEKRRMLDRILLQMRRKRLPELRMQLNSDPSLKDGILIGGTLELESVSVQSKKVAALALQIQETWMTTIITSHNAQVIARAGASLH